MNDNYAEKPIPDNRSYTICINEYQRKLFLLVLTVGMIYDETFLTKQPGDNSGTSLGAGYDTAYEEAQAIIDMLSEMPKVDDEDPGKITHGFCL